ncbi:Sulfate permease CysP [Marinomonas aquimarina]|uniref:Phosphate transporter n=1 Tax=Marinomonas aquimarina TaxID=295068 RepID=A0A1A8T6Z1_9GAMM|nr:inorganic phosphate transporter [Marinomonas aquimarina]SBS26895.1 Sulfate permease CysP [Marinomonas aquimarina]
MDLANYGSDTKTTRGGDIVRILIALAFVVIAGYYAYSHGEGISNVSILAIAAAFGAYMALNIGANDVANNVGPAVGSKALSMVGAILIAAVFEAAGALIAGGSVVGTIKKGIINPNAIADVETFIWVMMAALLAGAIWLNLATYLGAPVSTTHSIVGGVMGAGIAAGGWDIANWGQVGAIVASWVISPALGGIIAATFLIYIKKSITYKSDMIGSAKKVVPILVAIMVWAFSTYLAMKGLKKIWKLDIITALIIGFGLAMTAYFVVRPLIDRAANALTGNEKDSVNSLFTIPLIVSAALLSFAHGANDVANAIGPLAAINDALLHGGVSAKASIPLWVMLVGGLGIAIGLALFGPKLIRTVGSEITELDKTRAFCVAMAAAITVIIASQLGLPVSSTHIAVGGIFGVGFLREYLKLSYEKKLAQIEKHSTSSGLGAEETHAFVERFKVADVEEKRAILREVKSLQSAPITKEERKSLKKATKKELVKRSALLRIAAAWIITVPASAILSAIIFYTLLGFSVA